MPTPTTLWNGCDGLAASSSVLWAQLGATFAEPPGEANR
jgi:hypothetical protein